MFTQTCNGTGTCLDLVQDPTNFDQAYFEIAYMRVFSATAPSSSANNGSSTSGGSGSASASGSGGAGAPAPSGKTSGALGLGLGFAESGLTVQLVVSAMAIGVFLYGL